MKFFMFSICFLSIFTIIEASEAIDFFKFENNSSTARLYFKSDSDPELIENGKNFTVLFKGNYFQKEKISLSKDNSLLMKKLTIKNYENKGGALNILGKAAFSGKIERIAPDVVTIRLTSTAPATPKPVTLTQPINITSTEPKILKKKEEKVVAEKQTLPITSEQESEKKNIVSKEDNELNSLISSISKEKETSAETSETVSDTPIYILFAITSIVFGILFFINKKKKAGKFNSKNGKIMNIVETMQIGLKEKLLLVKVGESYVMLFSSDKDMKPMGTFSKESIGETYVSELKSTTVQNEKEQIKPQLRDNISSFQKKISSMITESNEQKSVNSAEEELYATLGRLRKIAVK